MPARRPLALLALLLLLAAPRAAFTQGEGQAAEAALTPAGLKVTLTCPGEAPPTLGVAIDGRPPVAVAPVAAPPAPVALALVVERSAAMAEAGTPYSSRLADAVTLASALLDRAPPGSQVSLLSFDEASAQELVAPTTELAAVRRALGALEAAEVGPSPAQPLGFPSALGAPAANALRLADSALGAGPFGTRSIIVFTAGGLGPATDAEGLTELNSSPRIAIVELADGGAATPRELGEIRGAREVMLLSYAAGESAALPGLFADYERVGERLLGLGGRLLLTLPSTGIGPGRHEVRVDGCGAPRVASFTIDGAAPPPGLTWLLPVAALPALGLGYGLWRRRARGGGRTAGEPGTARFRSPLEVTTARREQGPAGRGGLCALVWDGRERRTYRLTSRQCTIGREVGCTIRIESEWVSGLHARLSLVGAALEIADLESTNGTFIGDPGRPLVPGLPEALALGEVVRIGPEVRLSVYRADSAELEAPV